MLKVLNYTGLCIPKAHARLQSVTRRSHVTCFLCKILQHSHSPGPCSNPVPPALHVPINQIKGPAQVGTGSSHGFSKPKKKGAKVFQLSRSRALQEQPSCARMILAERKPLLRTQRAAEPSPGSCQE